MVGPSNLSTVRPVSNLESFNPLFLNHKSVFISVTYVAFDLLVDLTKLAAPVSDLVFDVRIGLLRGIINIVDLVDPNH